MREAFQTIRQKLDRTGIVLSGLCAVHCVLGVVLVGFLGLGGEVLLSPEIHRIGLVLAVVIGGLSLGFGVMRHGRILPLVIGAAGLALMALAIAVGHGTSEAILTVAGVALVALAHLRNMTGHASH